MQLGSVLRSTLAKDHGLQLSYLERIMDLDLYRRDETKFANHGSYDPMLVCVIVEVAMILFLIMWLGSVVVRRQTSDRMVTSSIPGRSTAR